MFNKKLLATVFLTMIFGVFAISAYDAANGDGIDPDDPAMLVSKKRYKH